MRRNLTKSSLGGTSNGWDKQPEIENLKQEVFQLKDLEYDLFRLNDEIASIQAKYSMALDEKDRNQNLLKNRMAITKSNVQQLQADVDSIKFKINQTSLDVVNLNRDNATLQRNCENKQNEILNLTISLKQLEKNNQTSISNLLASEGALQKIKEHRNILEQQCLKFTQKLNQNKDKLKDIEKQNKNQTVIQRSLTDSLGKLEQQSAELRTEMAVKENVLKQTTAQYDQFACEAKCLIQTNQKLEKQCKQVQERYTEMTKTLQTNQRTNDEKTAKLRQLENITAKAQQDLSCAVIKRQTLMKDHTGIATKNKQLNLQIDDCLMKILQLEAVNKTLQKHISDYITCDEQARILLDRRQKMTQLLQTVGSKLSKTESAIAHLI